MGRGFAGKVAMDQDGHVEQLQGQDDELAEKGKSTNVAEEEEPKAASYLEVFLDQLMRNLEARTASAMSKHAAATCAHELSVLVGPSIFRGRLYDDYQRELLDRVLRERKMEEENMAAIIAQQQQTQFSPFEPPGLLDNLDNPYSSKLSPGLPAEMLNRHPGVDDSMSM